MIILYDTVIVISLLMLAALIALLAGYTDQAALKDPVYTLYLFLVWHLYIVWFWRKGGMTVGMRAWRVRIVDDEGNRPGWQRCVIRFAVSLVSAAVAGAGFFWSLFDPQKRAWHDIVSRTRLTRY